MVVWRSTFPPGLVCMAIVVVGGWMGVKGVGFIESLFYCCGVNAGLLLEDVIYEYG